jgi:hypothetical protein
MTRTRWQWLDTIQTNENKCKYDWKLYGDEVQKALNQCLNSSQETVVY